MRQPLICAWLKPVPNPFETWYYHRSLCSCAFCRGFLPENILPLKTKLRNGDPARTITLYFCSYVAAALASRGMAAQTEQTGPGQSGLNVSDVSYKAAAKCFPEWSRMWPRIDDLAHVCLEVSQFEETSSDVTEEAMIQLMVKHVLQSNCNALACASDEIRGDRSLVKMVVSQDWWALQHAATTLRGDPEIVAEAVSKSGLALEFATEELKRDRTTVLQAVSQDGEALQFAADELRRDHEIVKTAIRRSWRALTFADDALRGDREIVSVAVERTGLALQYATEALRGDDWLLQQVLARNRSVLAVQVDWSNMRNMTTTHTPTDHQTSCFLWKKNRPSQAT